MKAVSKLAAMLSVGMFAVAALEAMTPEQSYISSCRKDPGVPVPIEVVSPHLGPQYEGATAVLEFVVDEAGKPGEITVKSASDFTVGLFASEAVSQWQFKPAIVGEKPVAMKVELPIRVTEMVQPARGLVANE